MTTMNRDLSLQLLNAVSESEVSSVILPTAHGMMGVRLVLSKLNLPVQYIAVGELALVYLVSDPSFKYVWESVPRREQVDIGVCGVCYGMEFITDFYFPKELKVLDPFTLAAISFDEDNERVVVHKVDVVPNDEQRAELIRRLANDTELHEVLSEMAINPDKVRP